MVVLLVFILLNAISLAQTNTPYRTRLNVECTPKTIYFGQQTECEFHLDSAAPLLEVEVAKFPEFRGYWKENRVLRQGKLPLAIQPPMPNGLRRTTIAAYTLTPMLEEPSPKILPMKLVTQFPPPDGQATILSRPAKLRVRALPPVPARWKERYQNAVGQFKLSLQQSHIVFSPGEPALVTFYLHGRGNFPEINTLPIAFPEEVKVLNFQALGQGSYYNQLKSFEWTVSLERETDLELGPFQLVYFDPELGTYQHTQTSKIQFRYREKKAVALPTEKTEDLNPVDLGPLEREWTPYHPIWKHPTFVPMNLVLTLLVLLILTRHGLQEAQTRRQTDSRLLLKKRYDAVCALAEANDLEGFLSQADRLVYDVLKTELGIAPTAWLSRQALLDQATQHLPPPRLTAARRIFETRLQAYQTPIERSALPTLGELSKQLQQAVYSRGI